MNNKSENQDSFDLSTFWSDLQDLEDGSISHERRDALMSLLDQSPAARRAYHEYFHQVVVFRMMAEQIPESDQHKNMTAPIPIRAWFKPRVYAAAALVMFAAIFSFLVIDSPPATRAKMRAFATLDSVWEINGVLQDNNSIVKTGDSVRLHKGMIRMKLESGSYMVMQNNSSVSFPSLNKPVLEHGWLWIDTGETNDSFEINTSGIAVRDIGTRFGVKKADDQDPEIHLHDGKVKVMSRESGIHFATLVADGKGQKVSHEGKLTEVPLAADPFPNTQSILSQRSDYVSAVMNQNPKSYLRFDRGTDEYYDNEVVGRSRGKRDSSVIHFSSGVNEDWRFRGFEEGNASLYFPASVRVNLSKNVAYVLDGDAGISSQQGSVSFWIKPEEGSEQNQALWIAGNGNHENQMFTGEMIYSYLTADGRICLSFVDYRQSYVIRTNPLVAKGTWHHIALTWGPRSASVHIDGEQAQYRGDMSFREDWDTSGKFVRFGKPTGKNMVGKDNIGHFNGWFDEFALWNRQLSSDEIARQFRAASGN